MNVYTWIVDYISNLPVLKGWNEAKALIDHAASMQPRDWQLPIVTCKAVGGSTEAAIPACAAIACAQVGIILIDDLLDEDPRGEYHKLGVAQTANYAAAHLSIALQSIYCSPAPTSIKLPAARSLNQMITTVAFGQYLDTKNSGTEEAYWEVARTKSAPFFGATLELGAFFGGAPTKTIKELAMFGGLYGEMVQIHDDLNDCMTEPAGPDWIKDRLSLPILFAQTVDHPERVRFHELKKKMSDLETLHEAQNILIRCGAVSYCFNQLIYRYQTASKILTGMNLANPDPINKLLEDLIAPVRKFVDIESEPSA
jgi:geranylgeranyl pyrophosphate synthase